jgi:hypothetical protein
MDVDTDNVIMAWIILMSQENKWATENMLFQSHLESGKSIIQIFPDDTARKFVLSTRESDHFWNINGQQKH